MSAAPLPWQAGQWARVERALSSGRLPHALLLRGPPGVGKDAFARALGYLLLCRAAGPAGESCGSCRSCRLLEAGTHPDMLRVEPSDEGKSIGIDQVRALSAFLSLTTRAGRHKVAVLHPAEQMTVPAANSLLKTLEEPPGTSVLILVSHRSASLLPTVVSRCQAIDLPAVAGPQAAEWLRARLGSTEGIDALLAASFGQPLSALAMAEHGGLEERAPVLGHMSGLLEGSGDPAATASRWSQLGLGRVLDWTWSMTCDLIRLKLLRGASPTVHPDLAAAMQPLAERLDLASLFRLLDTAAECSRLRSSHAGLSDQAMLETIAIAWYRAGRR